MRYSVFKDRRSDSRPINVYNLAVGAYAVKLKNYILKEKTGLLSARKHWGFIRFALRKGRKPSRTPELGRTTNVGYPGTSFPTQHKAPYLALKWAGAYVR